MGQGASFSAGADIGHMRKSAGFTREQNRKAALASAQIFHTLYTLGKPTIARVHGAVRGGGVGLVAACDIAVGRDIACAHKTEKEGNRSDRDW